MEKIKLSGFFSVFKYDRLVPRTHIQRLNAIHNCGPECWRSVNILFNNTYFWDNVWMRMFYRLSRGHLSFVKFRSTLEKIAIFTSHDMLQFRINYVRDFLWRVFYQLLMKSKTINYAFKWGTWKIYIYIKKRWILKSQERD